MADSAPMSDGLPGNGVKRVLGRYDLQVSQCCMNDDLCAYSGEELLEIGDKYLSPPGD